MSAISAPYFHDEEKARLYLEGIRWANGIICPHCGCEGGRVYELKGKTTRRGLRKCGECRKQFSVTVGTLFERSRIPLHKWLMGVYLMCSSKKGMSSHQLHRTLGITYKTAWFMSHRIREAMKDPSFTSKLGGGGKVVEVDETFWGNRKRKKGPGRGYHHKEKIFSLVKRGGKVRSFHVPAVTAKTLRPIMTDQISQDTHIITDEMGSYRKVGEEFSEHNTVSHGSGEYVRGAIHTNTIENYFSVVKRGLVGTFHHVGPQHLRRYMGEFDFRYNNREVTDIERAEIALMGIDGKRLMYRDSSAPATRLIAT
jgi:transposase-like protein